MTTMRPRLRSGALAAALAVLAAVLTPGGPATATPVTWAVPNLPGLQRTGLTSNDTNITVVVDGLTSTPETIDFDHPTVTVTGKVLLLPLDDDSPLPTSGGSVALNVDHERGLSTVAEDGTFSVSVRARGYADWAVSASLYWTPDEATRERFGAGPGWSDMIAFWTIPIAASTVRFVPDQARLAVKEGASATLSGVLQRRAGTGWVGVPSALLGAALIDPSIPDTAPLGRVEWPSRTTDAAGRASFTAKPSRDGFLQVTIVDGTQIFLQNVAAAGVARVPVDVHPRTTLKVTAHPIDGTGQLRVTGRLSFNQALAMTQKVPVLLQESKNGRSGWRTLARSQVLIFGPTWADPDGGVLVDTRVAHPSRYFRLRFAGTSTLQGSTSAVFRTSRKETRIVKLSVSPRVIHEGGEIVIKGVLQKLTANGYVKYGKKTKVYVYFRPKHDNPTKRWDYFLPAKRTRASGAFSVRMSVFEDGYWSVAWRSTNKRLIGTHSKEIYVNVRGK